MILLTVGPALILFSSITLFPILWAIAGSFFNISAFSPVWHWTGLGNYSSIMNNPEFPAVLWRSFVFAAGSVILQLVVGVGIALLVNREFKFSAVTRTAVLLPYLVPTAVLGFIALWMANSQFGIINQLLVEVGIIESHIAWFGSTQLAMLAVIVAGSWKFAIFVTLMVLARLQGIPDGYYEAAEVAGATWYQRFRDITLPNLKGVIFIVLLLRGIWMFNKFDIVYVLTQGGPAGSTTTAPIWIYRMAFIDASLGLAAAASTLLFVMLVVGAIIYFVVLEPSSEVRVE